MSLIGPLVTGLVTLMGELPREHNMFFPIFWAITAILLVLFAGLCVAAKTISDKIFEDKET